MVGSNDTTAPVIEASYKRFLHLFDRMLQRHPFTFGGRPSSADFGIYAQLTQLAKFDPTPAAICMQETPRIHAWTDIVDDLSGNPAGAEDWINLQDSADHLKELLSEIGRVYAPALLANAKALQPGEQTMKTTIDGQPWEQPTFPYQAKCLQWINEEYQRLGSNAQGQVDALIENTGCDTIIVK